MTNQDKRCLDKAIRLIRAIQKDTGLSPESIHSIAAEVTSLYPRFGDSERYHTRIDLTNSLCIESTYDSKKQWGPDSCIDLYMVDNRRGEYRIIAWFPSIEDAKLFNIKKEDVFKEEKR